MTELEAFLNSAAGQHIQQVYLNDKKEWLFAPRPGYETKLSRGQVLAYQEAPTVVAVAEPTPLTNTPPAKNTSPPTGRSKAKHSNRF